MKKYNILEIIILGMAMYGGVFQAIENLGTATSTFSVALTLFNIVLYSFIAYGFTNARMEE